MSNNIHQGHRERMRQKLLSGGDNQFSDHELLEMLLFYSVPRSNTNDTAHLLLDEFNSLDGVLTADYERLLRVKGVGPSSAMLITTIGSLLKRSGKSKLNTPKEMKTLDEVVTYLKDYFKGEAKEVLLVLHFSSSMKLLGVSRVAEGSSTDVAVSPTVIAKEAMYKNSAGVIIAHNHPNSYAEPTASDRNFTHLAEAMLAALNIALIEHIIVGDDSCTPMMMHRSNAIRKKLYSSEFPVEFLTEFYG